MRRWLIILCLAMAGVGSVAYADKGGDLVFEIELKDGLITPQRLEVPANQNITLKLNNTGSSAAEFESIELRKEKVLAPKSSSFIVIHGLAPGSYQFFDDFHPDRSHATIIAK